jgi:hypothetical protein
MSNLLIKYLFLIFTRVISFRKIGQKQVSGVKFILSYSEKDISPPTDIINFPSPFVYISLGHELYVYYDINHQLL